jgi:predicted component of type VI protein secretion system
MPAFLRAQPAGHSSPRDVAALAEGRTLIIGRNPSCDAPFPDDQLMSSRHASLLLTADSCTLRDLSSTNGTTLNGEPVQTAQIKPGDSFVCGQTTFLIEWTGPPPAAKTPAAAAARSTVAAAPTSGASPAASTAKLPPELAPTAGFLLPLADPVLARFQLRQSIPLTPEDNESPADFIQRLPSPAAKIEFLAFALHRRCAINWLATAITQLPDLAPEESAFLQLVRSWINSPSEDLRRQIQTTAEPLDPQRPLKWLGTAVFFSSGSITPAGSPVLAPDPKTCHPSIHAGLVILALNLAPRPPQSIATQSALAELALKLANP